MKAGEESFYLRLEPFRVALIQIFQPAGQVNEVLRFASRGSKSSASFHA